MPKYKPAGDWIISMNNQNFSVVRVPVIDQKGKPLMPTTPARARKWTDSGKAVGKRNKLAT